MAIKNAVLNPHGFHYMTSQIYEKCGRTWDSYEEAAAILEARAATGESISYEIPAQYTLSKRPEFVFLTRAYFTFTEIEE